MFYPSHTHSVRTICLLTLFLIAWNYQTNAQEIPVIPYPSTVITQSGEFVFSENVTIQYSDFDQGQSSHYIQEELMSRFGIYGRINEKNDADIKLSDATQAKDSDAYQLSIGSSIEMSGSQRGIFYAAQTLFQIMEANKTDSGVISVAHVDITDQPRYGWRGLMLDESRHFFGKKVVKQLLDWMAYYKLNVFHWHLTDSQGWRIEIMKYPYLTLIGGIGDDHNPLLPAQYYTQKDIKEIVRYARQRHITVVPEIDMPGHATAVNKAYPVFSGGGSDRYPEWTMHPTKDTVVEFLTDVLQEVDALFPAQMIHLGGDEVHFGNAAWNTDPAIQAWMKKNDATSLVDVEHYFINRMADTIRAMNNLVLGWDEIVTAGLPTEGSLVFWWRHDKPETLTQALDKGYDVVLCPRIPLYFDFVQTENHQDGRKWGGRYADIESVWKFPPDSLHSATYNDQIRGIQANIWTERIANKNRLDYMTFPRLAALGEAAWSMPGQSNYDQFLERMKPQMKQYHNDNLYFFNIFDPESTPEPPVLEGDG
ncbi:beta-N-acetylhexosaminidase [Membranicola marinus]|uniref:beta-N-acetylhexosaminidase n=1 Tax=Membranihabitans marinus TaxID=1227546 RepID=A0A953HY70_9BACT|nr:beta-N-acetylhexosaminidase [Membranihabitans marinus]MBY5959958.1 beta-N-acetylhexosaminidase [Membranihabitans marinus]